MGIGGVVGKVGGQVVKQSLKEGGKQEMKKPDPPKPTPAPQQQIHLPPVKNGTVQHHDDTQKGGCCASCTIM